MKKKTSLPRWAGFCALLLIAFVTLAHAAQSGKATKKVMPVGRADVITITPGGSSREMPPVTFLHEQHTKTQKDCSTCHEPLKGAEGNYSFALKGTENAADAKEAFHGKCIGCHTEQSKAGKKTGPVAADCRSCHVSCPEDVSNRRDIGFDKALHYRHTASGTVKYAGDPEKNCGACHHVYDAASQKLTWGKNKEDSCRACHLMPGDKDALLKMEPEAKDANGSLAKRPAFDAAGHKACVNCHLAVAAKKLPDVKSGPVECTGCHSAETQTRLLMESKAAQKADLPRLMRGQADAVLLLPESGLKNIEVTGSMRPVSFNHKLHESAAADCRTCHHKKIDSCSSCHSLEGKKEGNFVPLSVAMHSASSQASCIGCHNTAKQQPSCAGCHVNMPAGMTKDSCVSCHSVPAGVSSQEAENGSLLKLGKEEKARLAAGTVENRATLRVATIDLADIPEKVTVGVLSSEFEPAALPHRKIVATLLEKQGGNRLAAAFHMDMTTLCQGCHHNSPPSKTPPRCMSCHADKGQSSLTGRPALKAAYHLQCMTCHDAMDQKPAATECKDCHKPRGKQ